MGRIRSGAGRDDHSRRRAHDSPSTPALSRGAVARRSVPHMPTATTNANAKHGAISTRKQPCALLQYVTSLTSAEHNPQIPPRRQKIIQFGSKGLPGFLICQKDMVLAFKWEKARVWNRRGKPAPCLEWHHRIASDVEDQGRSFQFADLGANVEVIERVPQLPGVCWQAVPRRCAVVVGSPRP